MAPPDAHTNAETDASAGSCSLGHAGTSGTSGLVIMMAALGTLGLARRRRTG